MALVDTVGAASVDTVVSGGSYRSLGTAGNFFGQLVRDLSNWVSQWPCTTSFIRTSCVAVGRSGARFASTRLSRSTAVRRYGYPGAQFDVGDLR
jgi:hypothetical protein